MNALALPAAPAIPPRLRVIACGSVDDGKSTLLGRLLHECGAVFDDQQQALARDSVRSGTQGDAIDYALLLDGLEAEREQGITIDVAYRYFSSAVSRFVLADCPGHEQYTRNMATGASNADLAIVLVDARKGLRAQTRRHSWLVRLFGIRRVILAVNKMDLVDYAEPVFDAIVAAYRTLSAEIGIDAVCAIPVSGLRGDNVVQHSPRMPWYRGPSVLAQLDATAAELPAQRQRALRNEAFRMPVQWVCRPGPDFRGFAGQIGSGIVRVGDEVAVAATAQRARIAAIRIGDSQREVARAGQSVMLQLDREVDLSRGDVLAAADAPLQTSDRLSARLVWMHEQPLLPGRQYRLKIGTQTVNATVTEIKHQIDIDTQQRIAAKTLAINAIGVCNLALEAPVAMAPYEEDRALGSFILIDRLSQATVAGGTIEHALRRGEHVHAQDLSIDRARREQMKAQAARCVWFTGLSGAGKSTIANRVEVLLAERGCHTYLLDGDNLRLGLNRDLGFVDADRVENIRRVAEVARLMVDAGLIVLVSTISPFREDRRMARERLQPGQFVEVFVDTPLAECERRDVKGLYAKARIGLIPNFTGIDAPYEAPEHPDIHLSTDEAGVETLAQQVVARLLAER